MTKIEKNKFKRILYLVLGFTSLTMGIIGIFVPVWPTTVFILISAWAFTKSSDKFYYKLVTNKYFGRIIISYRSFKGIESKVRIRSLIILWATLGISIFFVNVLWVKLMLVAIGLGVTWHLLALRTLTDEELSKLNDPEYVKNEILKDYNYQSK